MLLSDNDAPARDQPAKKAIRAAAEAFSIEALPRDARRIGDFRDHLPEGTSIYVGWPPKTGIEDLIHAAGKLRRQGMVPVPHIAARRVRSEAELRELVRGLAEMASASELLLLGGDPDPPVGPYADASALLRSGVLEEFNIESVGFAAHPEGHAAVPDETLHHALQEKISTGRDNDLRVHVVSQFVLDPIAFIDWHSDTYSRLAPGTELRIGVPGMVSAKRLLQLASSCGLAGSLSMLRKNGHQITKTAMSNGATEALVASLSSLVDRERNISGFHFYPFGNFEKTAAWACAVSSGRFDSRNGEIRVH